MVAGSLVCSAKQDAIHGVQCVDSQYTEIVIEKRTADGQKGNDDEKPLQ